MEARPRSQDLDDGTIDSCFVGSGSHYISSRNLYDDTLHLLALNALPASPEDAQAKGILTLSQLSFGSMDETGSMADIFLDAAVTLCIREMHLTNQTDEYKHSVEIAWIVSTSRNHRHLSQWWPCNRRVPRLFGLPRRMHLCVGLTCGS